MNKLFLVYLAFFLAVVFAQPAKESNSIFVDKRGEVLLPKNRPECPSDKYTQCFLEVTATIGTCALGIVGSLTIEGWFSIVACANEVYGTEHDCYGCICDLSEWVCNNTCDLPVNDAMNCSDCPYVCGLPK